MSDNPSTFSLIDDPWIVVLYRTGVQDTISVMKLFAEAGEIRAIVGDLPTQTFAILRLLLAILHCSVAGPADETEWRRLWRSPRLPTDDIGGYLAGYRDRFDLLHPVTPFYQVAGLRTAKDEPVGLERLIADVPNGTPYLTARVGAALSRITPAEAARWLVHCQAYDTSGIKSGAVGDPRVKGGKGYPIGPGWCGNLGGIFLEGASLRETLLLNLIPEDFPGLGRGDADAPVWERDPMGAAEQDIRARGPFGPLSLYTWQSRRIRLFGDAEAITGALIANGDKLDTADRHRLEPLSGWRRSEPREKELKRSPVYVPARHDPARALWRGLETLLPAPASAAGTAGAAHLAPPVTEWLARIRYHEHVARDARVTVHAVGAAYGTQQSVIDQTIDDALTMTVQVFHPDAGLRMLIVSSAGDADAAVKALRVLAANLARAAGAKGDGPADAAGRAADTAYAVLDQQFRHWLGGLGPDTDLAAARSDWQGTVQRGLLRLGADLIRQAGPAAWTGREIGGDKPQFICAPLAEIWFRRRLHRELPLALADTGAAQNVDTEEVPA
ncbi:type I-E CRISPR-associated protein Cse1/CasA [Krasilnikovia sp. MM14-A1259]|uniref:type I-E CRISPR-associated protein Cse1/CasA n=1 Tax=Krasilnikovia sp. MM14-A1259 TaxID=3373539 RepID=UPI00381F64A5